ncbi:glutathione S-transferase family protein [Variovorax sp. EBFNA2]|uniref:glutathione S-transferase family protein n=1 Tax=Variovorax sp. EBFNA2 TaxID=3342097 RepID=UPI0029BFF316|nr:glutathione S-transferase family protein [Variovorax boronicumulans]WPG41552.1 glutathione S-transferase family protein [Variovorax boronicumulans]
MAEVRIFSYLPNPRVWKSVIAARIGGVDLEVRGAAGGELVDWLWDFDARPLSEVSAEERTAAERMGRIGFKGLSLYKTDAFLVAQPFGTVPAAFSGDGQIGIFESNSIMRAVARQSERSGLYGHDPFEASRIDSFLDVSLVFGRDAQIYLLALQDSELAADVHARADEAFTTYMTGIDRALAPARQALVGERVSLADICFACELALFHNELGRSDALSALGKAPLLDSARERFPRAMAHFDRLANDPAFAPEFGPYLTKFANEHGFGRRR